MGDSEGVTQSLSHSEGVQASWDETLTLGCALGARASGDATAREGAAFRAALAAALPADLAFDCRRRVFELTGLPLSFGIAIWYTYT